MQDGGSAAQRGTAKFQDGQLILREGDSFLLAAGQTFTVPQNPGHLTFEYDPSVEYGVRMTKLIDEIAPDASSDDDDAY